MDTVNHHIVLVMKRKKIIKELKKLIRKINKKKKYFKHKLRSEAF